MLVLCCYFWYWFFGNSHLKLHWNYCDGLEMSQIQMATTLYDHLSFLVFNFHSIFWANQRIQIKDALCFFRRTLWLIIIANWKRRKKKNYHVNGKRKRRMNTGFKLKWFLTGICLKNETHTHPMDVHEERRSSMKTAFKPLLVWYTLSYAKCACVLFVVCCRSMAHLDEVEITQVAAPELFGAE